MTTLKKMTKRLFLAAVAAICLAAGSASTSASLSYIGGTEDGGTAWLTCGSSAGNGIWVIRGDGSIHFYTLEQAGGWYSC